LVKLIAIDLDGTLLNNENKISTENLDALKHAINNGIKVVIATGRAHFDVQTIFKDSGINTWIIAANGATIHNPEGELVHSVPIGKSRAIPILKWLEEEEFYYEVFSNEAILTPQNGRELLAIEMDRIKSANPHADIEKLRMAAKKQFSQTGFRFIESFKEIEDSKWDIYNILAFSFHEEKLEKGWGMFKGSEGLTIVTSANHNFELEHRDASKGNALQKLAKQWNINLSEVAAIGDSMNDMSMLKVVGNSVAMGNARTEVKEICKEITLTNDENGVAHFINTLLQRLKLL